MNKKFNYCHTYSFHTYEENGSLGIRIFGINENNESVFILVDNFKRYIYLELPSTTVNDIPITWSSAKITSICATLDRSCKGYQIVKKELKYLKKLYFAKMDISPDDGVYTEKKFPFLKLYFGCDKDIDDFRWKVYKEIFLPGSGNIKLKIHELEASAILQFMCVQNIKPSSWIQFPGKEVPINSKESIADHEYIVSYFNITPYETTKTAKPLILSFDIEVNSENPNRMPDAKIPGDKVFQISAVFCRNGDPEEKYDKVLLTLCKKDGQIVELDQKECGEDIEIRMYETEGDLLVGFTELVCERNPQVICGYNIFSFDIPYMYERTKLTYTTSMFDKISFIRAQHSKITPITWSSKAYGKQDFKYLDAHGRLWVDLLPIVNRDYKLDDYKLKTVSEFFLNGQTKEDLPPKGIFKCYRDFTSKSLAICGRYCVMDSLLVLKLFEKLQMWIGLVEMSNVCNVQIFTLFTQGQQIKMFSQVYKTCLDKTVIDKEAFSLLGIEENDKYTGAYVFPPIPGVYNMVVSFDFCLTGDTLVSLSNGMSRRIDKINKEKMWVKDTTSVESGMIQDCPLGVKCNGTKKILKITMADGRQIKCTPNHKFLTSSGEWTEASNIIPSIEWDGSKMIKKSGTKLVLGLEHPEDVIGNDEKEWSFLDYNMETQENREKSLAFARMLGFILADGWVGERQIEACFGTLLDANLFCDDVRLLTGKDSSIRNRERDTQKGSTFTVNLLSEIAKKIIGLDGIVIGKRSNQKPSLPTFILDEKCPVSVVREFLGGLFGGDGCAPYLNAGNKKIKSRFGFISLKWDVIEKFNKDMEIVMDQLCLLTKKVGLEFYRLNKGKVNYYENAMKPKDCEENPRYSHIICLTHDDNLKFCEKIGFRYCLYKSCRLSIAASYQRLSDNVRRQHDMVYNNVRIFSKNNLIKSKKEIFTNEIPLNEYYSVLYYKKRINKSKLRLERMYFPDPIEYVNTLGVRDWFADFGQSHKKVYCVSRFDTHVPTFSMEVADVREIGEEIVYDIVEIKDHHNFFANGVCTHQCSLYPSIIIAYNIDYTTLVLDSTIPDDKCHVFKWTDHQFCEHDTTIRKTKTKGTVICKDRYYRFLKEPKGVIPTILENLLSWRKNTRNEIKKLEKQVKDTTLTKEQKDDIERTIVVLDKRQLSYKVNSNSLYGSLGLKKGYLPLFPGAMCVTYVGRISIEKASKWIQETHKVHLIYGDTDSIYYSVPRYNKLEHAKELDQFCRNVEVEMSCLFPSPMKLTYEEQIYFRYMIISKKRYMCLKCDINGNISDKITKRGVLLSRRDNSAFIRNFYTKLIMSAFYSSPLQDLVDICIDYTKQLFNRQIPAKDLTITKKVGDVVDYKIRVLPTDDKKLQKRLESLDLYDPRLKFETLHMILGKYIAKENIDEYSSIHPLEYQAIQEYITKALPGQVQLAVKLRNRGSHVDIGERIRYLFLDQTLNGTKGRASEKIEEIIYYLENSEYLKIDLLYYAENAVNPIEEILAIFQDNSKDKTPFKKMCKYRENYYKVLKQLKELFAPKIVLQ